MKQIYKIKRPSWLSEKPREFNRLWLDKNENTHPKLQNLYKKICEIKKYYSSINNDENYEQSLSILAGAKKEIFEFFDNVKVNEENETVRKNRLELINMLCKTFQNFINFKLLKANNE